MADFCKECSILMFGTDYRELAGISTEADTKNGLFANVICEGCGFIQVDHDGKCVSEDCIREHRVEVKECTCNHDYDDIEF